MRFILAAIFICAIGMPAASAKSTVKSTVKARSVSAAKAKPGAHASRKNSALRYNGMVIRPLVGSGDY
jgi:hypothetical protein